MAATERGRSEGAPRRRGSRWRGVARLALVTSVVAVVVAVVVVSRRGDLGPTRGPIGWSRQFPTGVDAAPPGAERQAVAPPDALRSSVTIRRAAARRDLPVTVLLYAREGPPGTEADEDFSDLHWRRTVTLAESVTRLDAPVPDPGTVRCVVQGADARRTVDRSFVGPIVLAPLDPNTRDRRFDVDLSQPPRLRFDLAGEASGSQRELGRSWHPAGGSPADAAASANRRGRPLPRSSGRPA